MHAQHMHPEQGHGWTPFSADLPGLALFEFRLHLFSYPDGSYGSETIPGQTVFSWQTDC